MSLFSTLFGLNTNTDENMELLSPTKFKQQVENKKVQLVDVRTAREYKSGHIKNALNIDFYSSNFNAEFTQLNKEEPLYIYCRSGQRSKNASRKLLKKMNFGNIYTQI